MLILASKPNITQGDKYFGFRYVETDLNFYHLSRFKKKWLLLMDNAILL